MSRTLDSDAALARRLGGHGDAAAFDELYRRHTPTLFAIAVRRLRDHAAAEDAVHDTWLRGVRAVNRFRGASSLRTWLVGILLNRVRELERSRDHESLDQLLEEIPGARRPADEVVDPIDLERAIEAMPARYQEVVILHDVEGFTHREIAELLAIDAGTSKSQLSRGRQWLRERLALSRSHDERTG